MKTFRKPEEWISLVKKYEQSGLSVEAFCSENGIHPNTFYRNRKKYKTESKQTNSFIELTKTKSEINNKDNNITVKVGSVEILVSSKNDLAFLRSVIKAALEAVKC